MASRLYFRSRPKLTSKPIPPPSAFEVVQNLSVVAWIKPSPSVAGLSVAIYCSVASIRLTRSSAAWVAWNFTIARPPKNEYVRTYTG